MPTYNEAGNIQTVITRILGLNVPGIEILIVDDNSPDGTGDLVARMAEQEPRLHLLRRSGKMGLGTAYVAGFRYAVEHGFEHIFEMDADLSHNPDDLPRLLEKTDDNDLVIGSRYLTGVNVINWPLSRLLLSLFANWYTRTITRMPINDCTSGFKCIHRRVLETIALDHIVSNGYAFQIELHYKIWRHGFRICEVPIVFTERQQGRSKMSRKVQLEAAAMVWRLKLSDLLGIMK
ncbi:MAG: polyprenol monophosphomannose synthase [candidate division KSB1 bacterium]|nr:polyprenol monophosphomannose synthase [candidate division KSB1 bacterium]MDZ7303377.1 polyprenol monophosphomannose synthase [candidate division KSB1 bacterium]MDZ7312305.1 polyprenol monophosphomannose synthase [candidate division KSB1 bacterium]